MSLSVGASSREASVRSAPTPARHRPSDLPQRSRVEGAAAGGQLRGLGHVRDVTQVRLGSGFEQSDRLRRLLLALVDEPRIA